MLICKVNTYTLLISIIKTLRPCYDLTFYYNLHRLQLYCTWAYLKLAVLIPPLTKPIRAAPHGWIIMGAIVPTATPPARLAFWRWTCEHIESIEHKCMTVPLQNRVLSLDSWILLRYIHSDLCFYTKYNLRSKNKSVNTHHTEFWALCYERWKCTGRHTTCYDGVVCVHNGSVSRHSFNKHGIKTWPANP